MRNLTFPSDTPNTLGRGNLVALSPRASDPSQRDNGIAALVGFGIKAFFYGAFSASPGETS